MALRREFGPDGQTYFNAAAARINAGIKTHLRALPAYAALQ